MPRYSQLSTILKLSLVGASGFVDAFGYLTIARIYTANMSGNSVALGINWARGNYEELFKRFVPILAFTVGIVAGAAIVELCRRAKWRSVLGPALALESVCLVIFMLLLHWAGPPGKVLSWQYAALAGLAAMAMGMQNSALYRTGTLRHVHTYVTGQLVTFGSSLAVYLFSRKAQRQAELQRVRSTGGIWISYVVGGALGAWCEISVGIFAFLIPIGAIFLIACIDFIHPLVGRRTDA